MLGVSRKKKSFDEATGLTNNTIRNQYAYLYESEISDLQIEDGRSQGFVAWKIDDLSHLSETDKNKFIKENLAPIELREGFTSGQENIRFNEIIGEEDLSGGGFGFTIDYIDQSGSTIPAIAKLSYTPLEKADRSGGGQLTFIDVNSNGIIDISRNSFDAYSYGNTQQKPIKDSFGTGRFEISLDDIGAKIRVSRVDQTTPGNFNFFVLIVIG